MSSPTLDIAIRLMVVGQELLIAAVFIFSANEHARAARIGGALLMLSIVGYLVTSSVELRGHVPVLMPFMSLLALAVPYSVWLFARAIFEAPWPNPIAAYAAALVGVGVWSIHQSGMPPDTVIVKFAGAAMRIVGLIMVTHALWIAAKGRPDDLVERRRRFRLFFIAAISFQVIAVLVVELFWLGSEPPLWLSQTNVVIIAVLTMGLALPLLRLSPEFFAADVPPDRRSGPVVDTALERKLLELMDGGYFCETGLTIRTLANRLKTPEHQLRRLINGHMGYRNFSAFLNSYRIAAAKQQLANAELAKKPVLTIALDLGYASLGPFNRAFKEQTGTTPTNYRRRALDQGIADSG